MEVCIHVEVPAPSSDDARSAVEDIFGEGELNGFNMKVTSFEVKEL